MSRFVILQSRACLKEVLNEVRNLRGEDLPGPCECGIKLTAWYWYCVLAVHLRYLQMRQARTSSLLSINERLQAVYTMSEKPRQASL